MYPAEVAVRGARVLLTQIFRYGFFHADPHPGNLRVLEGGVIAPLDYGMFGQLDARTRERIADLLSGLLAQDTDRVIRSLDALDIRGDHVDPRALRRDAAEIVAAYSHLTLDSIDLGLLLRELIGFIPAHPPAPASRPKPRPPDPIAGDNRGRRPRGSDPHF